MKRRAFIKIIAGSAVAWPLAARAEQSTMPVIGFLSSRASGDAPQLLAAVRQGLKDTGFMEGQNFTIEYRFAENQNDQLPALMADLVRRQVTVIAATGTPAALAAKAATTTVPIVFETGSDPIQIGLVASLNRPGGNVTGVTNFNVEVGPKRLELLHELVPAASVMALLVNPANPTIAETTKNELQAAARILGLQLHVLNASTEGDFDGVFAELIKIRAGGLVISGDPFFTTRTQQLAALVVRHAVPATYEYREFAVAGGLLSYGAAATETYRLTGVYLGRVLKGEKPADLPVQQATRVELIINLKAAKKLGLTVPLSLLGRAEEVIE